MTDVRMLVSWGPAASPIEDRYSNTLYFSVDGAGADPDYQDLADDLRDIYAAQTWVVGTKIEVRAYNMADAKPREEKAFSTVTVSGTQLDAPGQVALCLSYYSERNLPRRRGRIYLGGWAKPGVRPTAANRAALIAFGQALAGLGGLNVDWSVWSVRTAEEGGDPSRTITNIWVDDSWDIQRRRKLAATTRSEATISG